MIYPDYLFVLLITIIVISIIIMCCNKSRKNKSNILGDAVLLNMKKENYNNSELGDAIDKVVNSAFKQAGQTIDDDEDKSVTINYNGTVYQGVNGTNRKPPNNVSGYSGNDNHHNADTGSDNHVSKHDSYHHQHRDNHREHDRHVHHHHHHSEHHHHHTNKPNHTNTKCNTLGEDVCDKNKDCQWCISDDWGSCISKNTKCDNKPSPSNKECTMGGQPLPSEYRANGCNLYKNYNTCINNCAKNGFCGVYDIESQSVQCVENIHDKCNIDHKTNPNMNCLNLPDDDNPGFGCPNKDFTSNKNLAPINPNKHNGDVCKHNVQ